MSPTIINSIYKYIEVLYENNQKLIKLFGINSLYAITDGSKDILNLIQDIPRLIPYSYSKEDNKLYLINNDGLLQYEKEMPDLKKHYKKIIEENEECLKKVKRIRNKYEHILHNVELQSCFKENNIWFEYRFEIENKKCCIDSKELIQLFEDLNILYNGLISKMLEYVYKNELNNTYGFLEKVNLLGFNKLYESEILYEIGKAITGI